MRAATFVSSRARIGTGSASGTCGELLQGVLPGGRSFHVTCPVQLVSEVSVRVSPATSTQVVGLPTWASTTCRAIERAAELLELEPALVEVALTSPLPRAKGMASSTADVIAAARALAVAAGHELDPATLAELATSVEASDGVMYDGIVALDQHDGTLLRAWDWSPAFFVTAFVPPHDRVTADVRVDGQDALAGDYRALLSMFDDAMQAHDAVTVGALATRSAELNERFVPNPLLPLLRTKVAEAGAVGLCVGHSGTVCGLLFAPGAAGDAARLARRAAASLLPSLPPGTQALVTRMAG